MATKRGYYRAELERSIDNIEMALTHIARLIEDYSNYHPEIAEQIVAVGDALVEVASVIQKIHDSI